MLAEQSLRASRKGIGDLAMEVLEPKLTAKALSGAFRTQPDPDVTGAEGVMDLTIVQFEEIHAIAGGVALEAGGPQDGIAKSDAQG